MANEIIIDGRKVRLFDSMYDYVNDADLTHYIMEVPFVSHIKPYEDSDFMVWIEDKLEYEGLTYVKVNFGEDDSEEYGESFLLESALDEEVFMIFTEKEKGITEYVPLNNIIYETEELAYISGNLD